MDRSPSLPNTKESTERKILNDSGNSDRFWRAPVRANNHDAGDNGVGNTATNNENGVTSDGRIGYAIGDEISDDQKPSSVPDQRHPSRHPQNGRHRQQHQPQNPHQRDHELPFSGTTSAAASASSAASVAGERTGNPNAASRGTNDTQQHRHQHHQQHSDDSNYIRYKNEAATFAMASTNSTVSSSSTFSASYNNYHPQRSRYQNQQDGYDLLWHYHNNQKDPLGYDSRPNLKNDLSDRYQTENDVQDNNNNNKTNTTNNNTNNKNHNNKDLKSIGISNDGSNEKNPNNNGDGDVSDDVIAPPITARVQEPRQPRTGGAQSNDHFAIRFLRDQKPYVGDMQNGSSLAPRQPSYESTKQPQRLPNQSLSPNQIESPFYDPNAARAALKDRKPYVSDSENHVNPAPLEQRFASTKQAQRTAEKRDPRLSPKQGGSPLSDPTAAMPAIRDSEPNIDIFQPSRNHVKPQYASAKQPSLTNGTRSPTRLDPNQSGSPFFNPSTAMAAAHDRRPYVGNFQARAGHSPLLPASARQPQRTVEKRTPMPSPRAGRPPVSSAAPVAPSPPTPRLSRGGLSLARSIRYRRRRNLPPPLPKPPEQKNVGSPSSGSGCHPIHAVVVPPAASADRDDNDDDGEEDHQLAVVCVECRSCGGMIDKIPKNAIAVECPRCLEFFPTVTCKVICTNP